MSVDIPIARLSSTQEPRASNMSNDHCSIAQTSPSTLPDPQAQNPTTNRTSQPGEYIRQRAYAAVPTHEPQVPPPNPGNLGPSGLRNEEKKASARDKTMHHVFTWLFQIGVFFRVNMLILSWVEVLLQFAFSVLLLVGIALSPRDPFPIYLVAMDFSCAVLLGIHYCMNYCIHYSIYYDVYYDVQRYVNYSIGDFTANVSSRWLVHGIVGCALGSAYLGGVLYLVLPSIRDSLLGVSYVAIGYVARFYLLTRSIQQVLARLQFTNPKYEPFAMQLITTAVGLACHWLAISTLLHVLVYNIYPSKPKEFNFFDTMYYICLCLINGPTEDLIFDSIVARLVVIALILAVFLTLPGEFSKLSQTYRTLSHKRDKLDILVNRLTIWQREFVFIITGHLTLNSVMAMLTLPRKFQREFASRTKHVLLLDSQPLEPELKAFLNCQPWANTVHFYQYQELDDHVLEQLCRLSNRVSILADYNASLKDTEENVRRQDERNLLLGRRFSQWNQNCGPFVSFNVVIMQVVLRESLEFASTVCPLTRVVCLDDVFTSLFVHSTAAFGFNTLSMLYGTTLSGNFMKELCETTMSTIARNPRSWEGPVGQAISLFSLNQGSFGVGNVLVSSISEYQDYLAKRGKPTNILYLGAKLFSDTPSASLPSRPISSSRNIFMNNLSPHFVLNPVPRVLPQDGIYLLLFSDIPPDFHNFNLLRMVKKTSTDSAITVPIRVNDPTTENPNFEADQPITEGNQVLLTSTEISEPSSKGSIESTQFLLRSCADDEMDMASALPCKNHLVICDYLGQVSRQVLPFIRQARVAHNQSQLELVLITDLPLNRALRKKLKALGQVYIVRGTPHDLKNLQRANVVQARAVVAFHWVDDTHPETPVALHALSHRIRKLNPRVPLVRFTSSAIFRRSKKALKRFQEDPKGRFMEYWEPLASGEGIYMDFGYYNIRNRLVHHNLNKFLFPHASPESSYWATLDLDKPPFTWTNSTLLEPSIRFNITWPSTYGVSCEKLAEHLGTHNIVLVGLRRILEHSPGMKIPSVAFAPPGELVLFPEDQVILLIPRSLSLKDIKIQL